jgi:hypothetical protein
MVYARAHDQTVAEDYYAAMRRVEQRLEIALALQEPVPPGPTGPPLAEGPCRHLLALAEQLAAPELSQATRLELVAQLRQVLAGYPVVQDEKQGTDFGRRQRARPPPSPALGVAIV